MMKRKRKRKREKEGKGGEMKGKRRKEVGKRSDKYHSRKEIHTKVLNNISSLKLFMKNLI